MRLRSLTLWNFRRFRHVSIEFPDGVVGIIGPNGAGKSTLIEAIAWAIYGHPASRTKKEQIKRVGASPSEPCGVILEFYLGRDEYRVRREMVGQSLSPRAELLLNGEPIAEGERQVTSFLEGVIGMDYQSFITSVFARQKELNALSTMGPEERKRLILRMLKIDIIKKSLESLRSDKNADRKRMEGIKEAIIDESGMYKIDILKKERKEVIARKAEIKARYDEKKTVLLGIEAHLSQIRSELKDMEARLEAHNRLSQRLSGLSRDLDNRRLQLSDLERSIRELSEKKKILFGMLDDEKRYYELKKSKEELEREVKLKREELGEISKEEATLSKEIEHLKSRLQEIAKRKKEVYRDLKLLKEADSRIRELQPVMDVIQDLERLLALRAERERLKREIESIVVDLTLEEVDSLEKERRRMEDERIEISTRIAGISHQIEELEGASGACPTCMRPLADNERISVINWLKKEREGLSEKLEALNRRIKEIQALDLGSVRAELERIRVLDGKIAEMRREESEILDAIGSDFGIEDMDEIKRIRDEYQRLKGRISARSNLNEVFEELNREMIDVKRRIDEVQDRLGAVASGHLSLRKEVDLLENRLSETSLIFNRLEKRFNEIISLKTEVKRLDELKDTASAVKKEIKWLESEILRVKEEISTIGFDRERYLLIKKEEEGYNEKLRELERETSSIEKELSIVEHELRSIDGAIKEQNRLIELMDQLKEKIGYMEKLEMIFKSFEAHMISSIRPFLSEYASALFSDLTEGRYSGIEIGEAYDIMIQDSGAYYDLKRFSGGETDLANLCLRLAISNIVSGRDEGEGFEFLILDEIFGSQDAERKRNIMRVLEGLSRRFRQIFLITHVEEIKDYIGSFIRVVEIEEGVSGVEIEY
ncbi:MAG: SMC family ATPase [Candidatus Syntrophoarchaeum sp. WYZ-LMO15]|nr:MAG: SMC family ATPase [Candidatus Syntrophoarchaeum sp. WYZ-LMO15]